MRMNPPPPDGGSASRRGLEASSLATSLFEIVSIAAAVLLVAANIARLSTAPGVIQWYLPALIVCAWILADFASGIVHWSADTWGRESTPVLGPRFLTPFRIHHTNPDDFLLRNFIDTNGDVAMLAVPALVIALNVPLGGALGRATAVLLVAFVTFALPTNQVHQWAHMQRPPAPVRFLQMNPANKATKCRDRDSNSDEVALEGF
jgi:plasmanylethanolamine desaturase